MNDDSILGNTLGQLGGVIKQTAQQIVKAPQNIAEDASEQIGVKVEPPKQDDKVQQPSSSSDKDTKDFVKGLYAPSNSASSNVPEKTEKKETKGQPEFEKMIAGKSPEEQKKLLQLHQQLHSQYYQQLTNPSKQPEERPAEKVENEKKKEMIDLQKKEEEKPQPLAVVREQNKTEMFRGAAG